MPLTVAQLTARLTADTSNFYRGMALANSAMIRSGSIITRVAAGVGIATLGIGIVSLRAAGSYQASMNILEAVSGATTKQMGAMGDEAISLGKDFKLPNVSAKDAADAMSEMAKSGMSVNDILHATRGVLQLGVAANVGFSDSAKLVSRALIAFHQPGTEAVHVADLFTAAANKSTAEISDMALGFQQASAVWHMTGQSMDDLATSLTQMANAGIIGSDAGTSLKTMMNRLYAPTKKSKELMADLGIEVYDASGHFKAMPDIIQTFTKATKGMGEEQRNAALYTIFGSDAIRAASVTLTNGLDGWEKMKVAITKGGEAQAFAEARTKGFNGAVGALGSAAETLAIQLGTAMLPAAEAITRAMANFIASIDPNVIIHFFNVIADGVKTIYDFVDSSDKAQVILGALVTGIIAYTVVARTITAVTKAWAIAQGILNAVMDANPIVLAIAALAALAAAIYLAYNRSETFREIVDSAWRKVKDAAAWIEDASKIVAAAMERAWASVSENAKAIYAAILNAYHNVKSVTDDVWDHVGNQVTQVMKMIATIVGAQAKVALAVITAAWNNVKAVTSSVWNVISAIITNVIGVITGKISAMTALKNIISAIWQAFLTITGTMWSGIVGVVGTAISAIGTIITAMVGTAYSLAVQIGSAIVGGILHGLVNLAGAIKGAVEGALSSALGHINIPGHSPVDAAAADLIGKPIADGIIMGFLLGIKDLPTKMDAKLKDALEAGKRRVDAYQGIFSDSFSRLGQYATDAFDAATADMKTPAEKILARMADAEATKELKKNLADAKQAVLDGTDDLAQLNQEHIHDVQRANQELADLAYKKTVAEAAEYDSEKARAEAIQQIDQSISDKKQEMLEKNRTYADQLTQVHRDQNANLQAVKDAENAILTAALEKQAATERTNLEGRRAYQKQHLDDELATLGTMLEKHPEKYKTIQDKIIKLLKSYGISYSSAGKLLGTSFAKGLKESEDDVYAAARRIANTVARILQLNSPAREGPLSTLDSWWAPFDDTLLSGLNTGSINKAMIRAATPGPAAAAVMDYLAPTPAGYGTVVTYEDHYHIGTVIGTELDDAAVEIRDSIKRLDRRAGVPSWG